MPDQPGSPTRPTSSAGRTVHHTITVRGAGGKRADRLILLGVDEPIRKAQVLADPDYIKAFIKYERLKPAHHVTALELRELLADAGVVHGIDTTAAELIADLFANTTTTEIGPFEVARASYPQHGKEGHVEFYVQPTTREPNYDTDAEGNIDYHRLNLFENVVAGQPIAKLHPPGTGIPGKDVLGHPIPATDGKPASVRVGQNVSLDETDGQFYAEEDGRIEFDGSRIILKTDYEVHGDVDYNIGIIDFVGNVHISGAVREGFHVRGRKSVTVHGPVEACTVESDGNILLLGGMTGKGEGRIHGGALVKAKYINDVYVEAKGNVEVQNEMVGSTVLSSGRIEIPRGSIIGGRAMAFQGVEAGTLGSDLGVNTRVEAGLDWTTETQVEAIDERIDILTVKIDTAHEEVEPMLDNKAILLGMGDQERDLLQGLLEQLRDMRHELAELEERRAGLMGEAELEGRINQINVNTHLHPGVLLRFPETSATIKDGKKGPLTIREDKRRSLVQITEQKPMPDSTSIPENPDDISDAPEDNPSWNESKT